MNNDRCLQRGKEGSEYHRLRECDTHHRTRLEVPRDINSLEKKTRDGKESILWEKRTDSEAV